MLPKLVTLTHLPDTVSVASKEGNEGERIPFFRVLFTKSLRIKNLGI